MKRSIATILLICLILYLCPKAIAQTGQNIYSVCFVDEKTGWAAGAWGTIYHSSDGGITWIKQNIKTNSPLFSITFADSKVGWVMSQSGKIYHTVDGGKTWREQRSPVKKNLLSAKALSPLKCWAVGDWGTIVHTEDGGENWIQKTYSEDVVWNCIDFQEESGWIVGEMGKILYTSDGGKNWSNQESGICTTLFSVSFSSKQQGICVGLGNIILQTNDGGMTWQSIRTDKNIKGSLYEIKMLGNWGIAAGEDGLIINTVNGGRTWNRMPIPLDMSYFWFRGISVLGQSKKAVIVGRNSFAITTGGSKMDMMGFMPNDLQKLSE